MPDPQERKDGRSPLERVTGENDVSPEEERRRGTPRSDGKGRLQEAAEKVKEAAREAMGTGKRETADEGGQGLPEDPPYPAHRA
ncbi:hypothetical protein WDV06_29705 [Streptomyces racemochromogenes]|uniref:CsbD family protein n=1 Tax=Streptomyces racemochromogenes TaxID=67353 RepID=A0ABW7PLG0_9ACTN